ncbi:1-acyl-sn-glycerol-3-phosphate acyltransferase [Leptospira noguchii]|uniref:1-acyl-sn-glycerol-3-phosphate acyltransferase n=1 Tax=Leptospira noguchii TaxID=28182 RepID=A0A9Q8VSL6_9LEPT|nr:lysophospholipid acyltransferase family protein [Leptospira noguchii]EKR72454.1 acyltransferase [Leptospira noguchii str. 2006001870]EMI71811.1 acyltransferase [Leptospira noguchii str. Bonito]EMS86115.1 acyltransferase [Leptospira noguchii str. Cascata]EPE84036.1 acyltransferase [Leptospira noguchii str. 1993005606]TQE77565.1 1-acyl-sn-glycerol-3-phosphate acyltransferase [Leptospira noguchii]
METQSDPLDSLFLIPREPVKQFLKTLLHLVYSVEVTGTENIPETGGAVLISNHTDNLDVIIQGTSVLRKVIYLGKYELFHPQETILEILNSPTSPLNSFPLSLIRQSLVSALNTLGDLQGKQLMHWGGHPILRAHNVKDAKSAAAYYEELENYMVELIQKGELISVYPEGTRTETVLPGSFKALSAKLAIRAGVPIIPSGIKGAWKMLKPEAFISGKAFGAKITYNIGKPIYPHEFPKEPLKKAAKIVTEELENRVRKLIEAPEK